MININVIRSVARRVRPSKKFLFTPGCEQTRIINTKQPTTTTRKTQMSKLTEQINAENLRHHNCRESGETSWWEYDAQGIALCRVCRLCRETKLARYRPCILTGYTQADVDEPIEED